MSELNRVPLTIRLRPSDKEIFVQAAEQAGLEAGVAARTVMEMLVRRIKGGQTFFQAVGELERALGDFRSPDEHAAILDRIVERERRRRESDVA